MARCGLEVPGVPNAVALWVLIGAATMFLLSRTTFGRTLYAIGNTERVAYLSGINTRLVTVAAFRVCSAFAAFGGVLLAGYASKAAQSMGDAHLLPAIAAGGARRHVDSGRPGFVPGYRGWRDPHHAAAVDPLGRTDAGGGAPDHLRRGDRGDAAAIWAQQAGGVGFELSGRL
ncbi:ABC transporter permease [Paraburkholderia sp. RL17-337-BIB-A]|uniref:ABC transporter permease n=1 Tax=Paraburkholderia sp. RL17-337-BIB-A TaxID=3031636 RepID=UPI0038B8C35C